MLSKARVEGKRERISFAVSDVQHTTVFHAPLPAITVIFTY